MKPLNPARVSVVIPVLNAAPWLPALRRALAAQRPAPPTEILLVDSGSADGTASLAAGWPGTRVVPLARFSHGRARNVGAREASGEVVVFLTQDALPADERWLGALLEPLADPGIAAVCSRQVPRPEAPPTERFFLAYHFPPGAPVVRRADPARRRGDWMLADVFFSNVSAAIRRDVLLRHPFDETIIMSEDQQLARDLLAAGLAVAYQPQSVVIHSHRYSLGTAFRRYFDSVYSLRQIFPAHDLRASAALGRRYVRQEARYIACRHPALLPYYALYTLSKTAGALAGQSRGISPTSAGSSA